MFENFRKLMVLEHFLYVRKCFAKASVYKVYKLVLILIRFISASSKKSSIQGSTLLFIADDYRFNLF